MRHESRAGDQLVAWSACFVVVYVLSMGPLWALARDGIISDRTFHSVYRPLRPLVRPETILYRYINWWAPIPRKENVTNQTTASVSVDVEQDR